MDSSIIKPIYNTIYNMPVVAVTFITEENDSPEREFYIPTAVLKFVFSNPRSFVKYYQDVIAVESGFDCDQFIINLQGKNLKVVVAAFGLPKRTTHTKLFKVHNIFSSYSTKLQTLFRKKIPNTIENSEFSNIVANIEVEIT